MERTKRSIDAVLRSGDVPWVVELKVNSAGQGEYSRHAIALAVLYRHFVRTASSHNVWFAARGLAKEKCSAAIAIPALQGRDGNSRRMQHELRLREQPQLFGKVRRRPERVGGPVPQP